MSDDLVERLRGLLDGGTAAAKACADGGCVECAERLEAADEIERLRRWKAEAIEVFDQWERVWGMVPHRTQDLRRSKADVVADKIEQLQAAVEAAMGWLVDDSPEWKMCAEAIAEDGA